MAHPDAVDRPKRPKRQVRRKGNNRTWAKWTLRQVVGRTFRAMKQERPKTRVDILLGYDRFQFIDHVERYFLEGMSWELLDDIHIDHVIPLKWFIENGVHMPHVINDLDNLRPIWAKDNLKKSSALPDNFEELVSTLLDKHGF